MTGIVPRFFRIQTHVNSKGFGSINELLELCIRDSVFRLVNTENQIFVDKHTLVDMYTCNVQVLVKLFPPIFFQPPIVTQRTQQRALPHAFPGVAA